MRAIGMTGSRLLVLARQGGASDYDIGLALLSALTLHWHHLRGDPYAESLLRDVGADRLRGMPMRCYVDDNSAA